MLAANTQKHLDLTTIKRILDPNRERDKKHYTPGEWSFAKKVAARESLYYQLDDETLNEWKNSHDWRLIAYILHKGTNAIDPAILHQLIVQPDYGCTIFENCKDVPVGLVNEVLLASNSLRLQIAAANYCKGKNIPEPMIDKWLTSQSKYAIIAANNAQSGIKDPSFFPVNAQLTHYATLHQRAVEPKGKVYKQCLGEVIVVAKIPETADIRGGKDRYGQPIYRANKAVIVDVIGDFFGEKIGISYYDGKTKYRTGDQISINDFDYSTEIYSTGFHFFLTKKEARNFIPF